MSDDPLDKLIGARVRARRTLQGVSQEKLAAACNLTFQQIQKYEAGKNRISGSMLVHIARALACPVAMFFEGLEQGDADFSELDLSADAIKIGKRFDAISDPYVKEIMVKTLGAFERAPARETADG